MKKLLIQQCSSSLYWYRNKIGTLVDFIREDPDYFWSREPAGYSNIVDKRDAIIVTIEE